MRTIRRIKQAHLNDNEIAECGQARLAKSTKQKAARRVQHNPLKLCADVDLPANKPLDISIFILCWSVISCQTNTHILSVSSRCRAYLQQRRSTLRRDVSLIKISSGRYLSFVMISLFPPLQKLAVFLTHRRCFCWLNIWRIVGWS